MKMIGKYRAEGDQIIHPSGEAVPEDEPLFLLRGKDQFGLSALRAYMTICKAHHCSKYHLEGLRKIMDDFGRFKRNNPDRMKQPGRTGGK